MKKQGIQFHNIHVQTINDSSGIFVGSNVAYGWSAHSKRNVGQVTQGSKNKGAKRTYNVVIDNDVIDAPIDDRDRMSSRGYVGG
ncbi:MAG TPA: hypothetical protein VFV52_10290 [Bacilli bacterium]|nr:hypothetical protein [Bacilli bacterium]